MRRQEEAMAERSLEGKGRRREAEERHTHYLSSPSGGGIPQDWERCKEGGMLAVVVVVVGVAGEDERFEA